MSAPSNVRGTSRRTRVLVAAVGGLVTLNLGLALLDRATSGARSGPASSSFTTDERGLAAYETLLRTTGDHPVVQLRERLDEAPLDRSMTLVIADAVVDPEEQQAVVRFVRDGGRLVAAGDSAVVLASALGLGAATWSPDPFGEGAPSVPVPEVAGVERVVASGAGVWSDAGPALPVVTGRFGWLLLVSNVGSGRVALLSTASPLHNRLVASADNAALGLALAGERGRRVAFAEHPHGYGLGEGLQAIPAPTRWAMAGIALAALVWMWSRGRRLGPPEDAARVLPPPRRLFVEAVATNVSRSADRRSAAAIVQRAARERIGRIAGLPPYADDAAFVDAATRLGLSEAEAHSLVDTPADDAAVVAAGRAFARSESMSP